MPAARVLPDSLPDAPARQRQHGARIVTFALVVWTLVGVMALFSFASARMPYESAMVAVSRRPPHPPGMQPDLDLLRNEAVEGNRFDTHQLAVALMDKYDSKGDSEDLYEAMIWVDRGWEEFGDADLVGRVVAHYCDQRVVRWHPFCNLGE